MSIQNMNNGYLELILGPMYSGKSSRLVEVYKQCKFCRISVAVINHSADNRYDTDMLSTHDKIQIPCIKTETLLHLYCDADTDTNNVTDNLPRIKDKYKVYNSKVILINEGQFFPDLCEFVNKLLEMKKQVYVCGLDGDFERKKFGQMLDLIPMCDKVTKFTSMCSSCKNGTRAIFSMRLTKEKEQTLVGSDNYIPVCRQCYNTYADNSLLCIN